MRNRFSLSLFALMSTAAIYLLLISVAQATDFSWTASTTSPAIGQKNHTVYSRYQPNEKALERIPAGAKISQVYANRNYVGDALIRTQLCWNSNTHCVNMDGQHLTTQAFNGLDPSKPMYLLHTVLSWGPSLPPVFVVGNVNVWFTPSRDPALEKTKAVQTKVN